MHRLQRSARTPGLRHWLAGLLGLAWALPLLAAPAAPQPLCHITYGGETRQIRPDATMRPLDVAPIPIGSYFLWRAVLDAQELRIQTYADRDGGPVPIHQATFPTPQQRSSGRHGFTGLQRVYEPVRDGELEYWCENAPPAPRRPAAGPKAAASVRLLFAGDLMLDDGPGRTIAAGRDPLAPFEALLQDADYRIGNLECPIATTGQPLDNKIYTFRADPRVLPVLQRRFDAVSVANNHSGDYGRAAFVETLELLRGAGIAAFGGGRNLREAHAPLWIERGGLRIAVLGYNEFKPRAFEAGATWPGIAWSEDAEVLADIRAARQAGADLVLPFMHWGWEREPEPSERQRALARLMIDAGADAVIGGHPHVTQGADHYKGRPIIWSLGNFVFDGFELPAARVGWLLQLTLDAQGVVAWHTVEARIDAEGTPRPAPAGTLTPCGKRGDQQPGRCDAATLRTGTARR